MKYEEKIVFKYRLEKVHEELRELVHEGIRFRNSMGIDEELDRVTDNILHAQIDIGVAEMKVKEGIELRPKSEPYKYKMVEESPK
jgi:hypothetical protein